MALQSQALLCPPRFPLPPARDALHVRQQEALVSIATAGHGKSRPLLSWSQGHDGVRTAPRPRKETQRPASGGCPGPPQFSSPGCGVPLTRVSPTTQRSAAGPKFQPCSAGPTHSGQVHLQRRGRRSHHLSSCRRAASCITVSAAFQPSSAFSFIMVVGQLGEPEFHRHIYDPLAFQPVEEIHLTDTRPS